MNAFRCSGFSVASWMLVQHMWLLVIGDPTLLGEVFDRPLGILLVQQTVFSCCRMDFYHLCAFTGLVTAC